MEKLAVILVSTLIAVSWAQIIEIIPLPCNDKTAEKIGRLSITYINEDRAAGYKFSLNRISNVHLHVQGPAGKVYYLDLEVLETKCHVSSPKPWKKCDIRPVMETQTTGSCNVTILQTPQGLSYLYNYECTLVPEEPEKLLQMCPHCPLLVPVNSAEALQAARMSLNKYNAETATPGQFRLGNITRASTKNKPGQSWFVEFTIQEMECPEEQENSGLCRPGDLGGEPAGFCTGAVHGKGEPVVEVSCEIYFPQEPAVAVDTAGEKKVPEVLPDEHEKSPEAPTPEPATPQPEPDPKSSPHVQPPPIRPKIPTPKPFAPSKQPTAPKMAAPGPSAHTQNSSSSESSESSEELGGTILRPPVSFWYKHLRIKRQALLGINPNHTPVFLSVFPNSPSPFRSCPGAPRFSTV